MDDSLSPNIKLSDQFDRGRMFRYGVYERRNNTYLAIEIIRSVANIMVQYVSIPQLSRLFNNSFMSC